MAKKAIDKKIVTIKKALEESKVIIGTHAVLKGLRENTIAKIFFSENTPADVQKEINDMAAISDIEIQTMNETNVELGVICKKPFSISVLAIR